LPRLGLPDGPIDLNTLFPGLRDYALEVGFGGGEHLTAQAHLRPDRGDSAARAASLHFR
jgi:tRNA (guanine-N7-)-methyltransferase